MLKRLALPLLVTLATIAGCTAASDQVCIKNLECQDNADPAGECAEQKQECEEDEECKSGRDACQTENEALAACVLSAEAESECQGVGDLQFFLPTAEGVCDDELDDFLACQDAN